MTGFLDGRHVYRKSAGDDYEDGKERERACEREGERESEKERQEGEIV